MHEAGTRVWRFDDETKPSPEKVDPQFSQDTVDPLEAGCARALADVIKHDTDSNYAKMAAREFLAMWRFVMDEDDETPPEVVQALKDEQEFGRVLERGRIQRVVRDMITERLRFIGLLSPECARERTLALGALQEVLDAIDPPSGPIPPRPVEPCLKVAA